MRMYVLHRSAWNRNYIPCHSPLCVQDPASRLRYLPSFREALVSNLDRNTGYRGFSQYLQANIWRRTRIGHANFLPNSVQLTLGSIINWQRRKINSAYTFGSQDIQKEKSQKWTDTKQRFDFECFSFIMRLVCSQYSRFSIQRPLLQKGPLDFD